jgi:hypothetical protein
MNNSKKYKTIAWILVFLFLIGLLLSIFSFLNLRPNPLLNSNSRGHFHSLRLRTANLGQHQPLTIKDVSIVQNWMTFSYLNKVFILSDNYLADTLKISDPKYPNITIRHYTREKKIDPQNFLVSIQDAIANNLKQR